MGAIFISYRRDDTEGQAGRLFDELTQQLGRDAVFMDVAAIEPGRDFRRAIEQHVGSCTVLLAVIGKSWLTATDESGARRLDDPLDFVRLETASALKRDIPVVPVLVHGAKMPKPSELPDDLRELAFRNGVELTHARWDSDVQVLLKALRPYVENLRGPQAPLAAAKAGSALTRKGSVLAIAGMGALLLSLGYGGWLWQRSQPANGPLAAANPLQSGRDAAASAAQAAAALKGKQDATVVAITQQPVPEAPAAAGPAPAVQPNAGKPADKPPEPAAGTTPVAATPPGTAAPVPLAATPAPSPQATTPAPQTATPAPKPEATTPATPAPQTAPTVPTTPETATPRPERPIKPTPKVALVQPRPELTSPKTLVTKPEATISEAPLAVKPALGTRWKPGTFPAPNGGFVVYRITPSGDPACASYDGRGCLWGVRYPDLELPKLRPLVCGAAHKAVWGTTGYEDPKHWCSLARSGPYGAGTVDTLSR